MQTPTYIAKKIGDHYEIVDKGAMDKMAGLALVSAGSGLVLFGVHRGGIKGLVCALIGGYSLYYAATRTSLCHRKNTSTPDRATSQRGPSYPGEHRSVHQKPEDNLQEASMESFPASDPPARMATTDN
jgi:hypothetical protein